MNASDLIRERFSTLSPGLQRAGKYALDHPNEIVTVSMRSIAVRAEVPPATLVRFAQTLGFAGWPQLKEAFALELGLAPEQYGQRAQSLIARSSKSGGDTALQDELFAVQAHNLQFTKTHNGEALGRAAALLVGAPQLHVAGFRASYALAFHLAYGLRLFRPSVQLLDGHAGGLEMQLRALQPVDTVLVVGFAPYSREAEVVAQAARQRGCKLVAITDSTASPLSLLADETLLFSVHSPSFFPSTAAGMALVEALLELVVAQSGSAVVGRIAAAENQLFTSGAYLQKPAARAP
ncbi:MurR/RpiR family transcriptional regulator [Rhodoferax sp.]|uniref:MurR/RpiR family transcriptional regulator n=1 Tax=Rhodoferax sp. TaxID=50421 RepID=UPI0025D106D6|nr:MurR/RpiR family transcriptional regulator [Rhodoferax sp.]